MTFIGPDEERYAPDLVRALKESGAPIPEDLQVGALCTCMIIHTLVGRDAGFGLVRMRGMFWQRGAWASAASWSSAGSLHARCSRAGRRQVPRPRRKRA